MICSGVVVVEQTFSFLGSLTVNASTIRGNKAATDGGGIYTLAPTVITNATMSGNSAAVGGGLFTTDRAVSIRHSTVAMNSVTGVGKGIFVNSGSLSLDHQSPFVIPTLPQLATLRNPLALPLETHRAAALPAAA